jgi:ribosome-associated translation inhibitor RaiA
LETSIARQETEIPIQIIGLPKNDIETRKAEVKFRRSLETLLLIHPNVLEARAVVKTISLEKERKRYEVRVLIKLPKEQFDLSDEAWSVEELFEKIGVKIKRLVTKPRDKPSHNRHPSRSEMEEVRFNE